MQQEDAHDDDDDDNNNNNDDDDDNDEDEEEEDEDDRNETSPPPAASRGRKHRDKLHGGGGQKHSSSNKHNKKNACHAHKKTAGTQGSRRERVRQSSGGTVSARMKTVIAQLLSENMPAIAAQKMMILQADKGLPHLSDTNNNSSNNNNNRLPNITIFAHTSKRNEIVMDFISELDLPTLNPDLERQHVIDHFVSTYDELATSRNLAS